MLEGMNALRIEAANAKACVRTRDHPPPHVHVVNRADRWEARLGFSFLADRVWLIDVTPMANAPVAATLNAVAAEITAHLDQFRADWWAVYRDADLVNRWVCPAGPVMQLRRRRANAIQVASACYDPVSRLLSLVLGDGRRLELSAGSGRME
jgi:hypothetical protein